MSPDDDSVARAAALAEEFAPDLDAILFTHYPDAESLDTLRPGSEDSFQQVNAASRAAAAVLARQGVQVFVQRADRGAFRRWMDGRADTMANRLAWRDRERLLRGPVALQVLGVEPGTARPRPIATRLSGSPADRLMRAFGEGGADFEAVALQQLQDGREGVLELAGRKVAERFGAEAAEDYAASLLALAEGAELGPSGWVTLVALPVALQPGLPPDAEALGASLTGAGLLPEELEIRLLPEWRAPEQLGALSPIALRRVLLDLVERRDPADLPPADPETLSAGHFGVLIGLQIDWEIPVWEDVVQNGLPEAPEDEEDSEPSAEEHAREALFDRWRAAVFDSSGGCVPLNLVTASQANAEIAVFLEEAGGRTEGLDEIRNFIAVAREEAEGEEVVCWPEIEGDALNLSLYTRRGQFLDQLSLSADQLPTSAAQMPPLLAAFVTLVEAPPNG